MAGERDAGGGGLSDAAAVVFAVVWLLWQHLGGFGVNVNRSDRRSTGGG